MDREFTEREGVPQNPGFGELPEDLRGMLPWQAPDPTSYIGAEVDVFSSYGGAIAREFMEPVPGGFGSSAANWSAINYLPRANYESFRSQRFFLSGSALVPPSGGTTFTPLLVDIGSLPGGSPQIESSGVTIVPSGFAAVLTGLRQFIGDATAFEKPNGQADDIRWRIEVGGAPVFNFGNFPCMISGLDNEGRLFALVTEGAQIQFSVTNAIIAGSQNDHDIPIKGALTGHQFPMDELDDIFRNR